MNKIVNIEKIKNIYPKGSSSTGYSQYIVIKITYSDGYTIIDTIDNWYTSFESQLQEFKQIICKHNRPVMIDNHIEKLLRSIVKTNN